MIIRDNDLFLFFIRSLPVEYVKGLPKDLAFDPSKTSKFIRTL